MRYGQKLFACSVLPESWSLIILGVFLDLLGTGNKFTPSVHEKSSGTVICWYNLLLEI